MKLNNDGGICTVGFIDFIIKTWGFITVGAIAPNVTQQNLDYREKEEVERSGGVVNKVIAHFFSPKHSRFIYFSSFLLIAKLI